MGGKGSGRTKGARNKKVIREEGIPSKKCVGPECKGNLVPVSSFGKHRSYCKKCNQKIQTKWREENIIAYKVREIKRHARIRVQKGRSCEVAPNIQFLIENLVESQKYCYYSGVLLTEKVNDPNAWSVDRLDFNEGYVDGNMVLCTTSINIAKGSVEYGIDKLIALYGKEKGFPIVKKSLITIAKNYTHETSEVS